MDRREVEEGGGGQGGNAAICWAPVGWLSQYGEDWSGWIGGRLPDGLKVEVRGAGGKRKRPDEVGRSWSHQAPLKGPELQNRGGWGQGVGPRSIAKQGGLCVT